MINLSKTCDFVPKCSSKFDLSLDLLWFNLKLLLHIINLGTFLKYWKTLLPQNETYILIRSEDSNGRYLSPLMLFCALLTSVIKFLNKCTLTGNFSINLNAFYMNINIIVICPIDNLTLTQGQAPGPPYHLGHMVP